MKAQSAGGTGGKSDGFGPNSEDISPLDPGSSRGAPGVGNIGLRQREVDGLRRAAVPLIEARRRNLEAR